MTGLMTRGKSVFLVQEDRVSCCRGLEDTSSSFEKSLQYWMVDAAVGVLREPQWVGSLQQKNAARRAKLELTQSWVGVEAWWIGSQAQTPLFFRTHGHFFLGRKKHLRSGCEWAVGLWQPISILESALGIASIFLQSFSWETCIYLFPGV